MVFDWSLSESKSPQVSWILLSILANLNHAMICMVSILPLISSSLSFLFKPLRTVPCVPTTIGIAVMFHNFFSSLARSKLLLQLLLLSCYSLQVFHTSVNWMTASLLQPPGLFSVFWQLILWFLILFTKPLGIILITSISIIIINFDWYFISFNLNTFSWDLESADSIPSSKARPTKTEVMTLNCIWWWGSSSGDLESVEYPFIVITPISTLIQNGSTF